MGQKNGKPVLTEEQAESLAASSGMDASQVREQFDAFVAEHPNGKMKKKEFREMMTKAMPKKDASKMESHVFRIYDSNNDGVIDFVEFMVVFYIMSDGTPQEVLAKIFRVFDVNSDGTINKKELGRLIKDMYGLINADNPEEASKEFIAASAFAEMDKDEDGKITTEEFVNACLGQEQFSKMLALKIIDIFVDDE
jgi:Ca2+-binding EF-hand superfamily protein